MHRGRDRPLSDIWHWLHGMHSGGESFLSPNRATIYMLSLQCAGESKNWSAGILLSHLQTEIPITIMPERKYV